MKNLIVLKITKSLCAFFLIFALLICANPMALYAEELTETEETTSTEETTETTAEEITTTETTSETTTTETTSEETTTAETTSEESAELIAEGEEEEQEEEEEVVEEEQEEVEEQEEAEEEAEEQAEEQEPTGPVASENAADPEDGYKIYKYMINIEYGTLSFYYDWGIWDTDYCMYTAEKSSFGPSKETQSNTVQLRNQLQGQLQNVTAANLPNAPGWYGFDGTANKISITNLSGGSADVYVRFDYSYETDGFNTSDVFPRIVQPTVTYYFDEEMSESCGTQNENYQIMKIPYSEIDSQSKEPIPTNIYVSLAGAPYYTGMEGDPLEDRYHADTATQIGFLTVTVGVSPESLMPPPAQSFSLRDEEEEELELIESTATEETTSAEETTTVETTSAEETTTVETTSTEETTTVETTSTEETTTVETTSAEETTTVETTSAEETTTAETTSAEETTTVESSSMEESTTQEQISTE